MIVRWGLAELPGILDELSISRPLLVSSERWHHFDLPARDRFHGVRAHAGAALRAGTGLGHAMAQALGGRYGLPHGTMNAVSLPAALRFNSIVAAGELARFGEAIDRADPKARVRELAALAGPSRLRDYQVPRDDLSDLAQAITELAAAKANPRPAPPDVVFELLEEMW